MAVWLPVRPQTRVWHRAGALCLREVFSRKPPPCAPWGPCSGRWIGGRAAYASSGCRESQGAPSIMLPPGPGRGLLDGEKCNVSSCWWGLHSFLVKYCAWKTRIYGQHSSYKQSNCTLWRNCFVTIGGRLPWLLPPPPPPAWSQLLPTWNWAARVPDRHVAAEAARSRVSVSTGTSRERGCHYGTACF